MSRQKDILAIVSSTASSDEVRSSLVASDEALANSLSNKDGNDIYRFVEAELTECAYDQTRKTVSLLRRCVSGRRDI